MDDRHAVDNAFKTLVADPRAMLRPPAPDKPLAIYRARLDAPMAAVRGPACASVETVFAGERGNTVDLRIYRVSEDAAGTILFFHGGGFVVGSLDTHDAMCRMFASASGATIVAAAYRLAPEAPFPAAGDDCRAALRWTVDNLMLGPGSRLAICGDSAGGHLAVTTALYAAREHIPLHALGLLYPVVDPSCDTGSWEALGVGYLLTRSWMRWAWQAYIGSVDPSDPDISLLRARLSDLPPTRIITAACDPLRDEGEALGAAILAAGGSSTVSRFEGMVHGFASLPMVSPRAGEAIDELVAHFRQHIC